ncbi:MAG TPA: PEGA domain-containing protein [Labilithrix sp.]|nr:PEGA domain-containing protein [Labilithrix sp.]
MMVKRGLLPVVAVVTLTAANALAAEPDKAAQEAGRAHFDRAVELYRESDFRGAIIEFRRAYNVAPNYRVLYNIGQTCLELHDYSCAIQAFEKYMGEGGEEIPAERRAQTEQHIARLATLVARVTVTVNRPGADVLLDDVSVGKSPLSSPLVVGSGHHRITATLSPHSPATKAIDVAAGDRIDVALELADVAPATPAVAAPVLVPVALPVVHRPSRVPVWIGLAFTAVATASAVTFGVLSLSADSNLDSKTDTQGLTKSSLESAQDRLRTMSLATDISIGAAVVGAIATTVLYVTTHPSKEPVVRAGPTALSGTFHF